MHYKRTRTTDMQMLLRNQLNVVSRYANQSSQPQKPMGPIRFLLQLFFP